MAPRNSRAQPFLSEVPRPSVANETLSRALAPLITSLGEAVKFLDPYVRQEAWRDVEWGAGWGDYAVSTDYQTTKFRKDPLGRVWLRGLVARTVGVGTTIFNLPRNYRPAKRKIFPVFGNAGVGRVDVYPNGVVEYSSGGTTFLTLEGISFDTAE